MVNPTAVPAPIAELRPALDTLKQGVVVTDEAGRVVYANQAFLDNAGLERDAVAGRPIRSLLAAVDEAFDPETGLPLERMLAEPVRRILAQALRKDRTVAVARLALTGPGTESSTPEPTADALRSAATRLQDAVRESDLVGRASDGDLVLVLQEVEPDESLGRVASRLLAVARADLDPVRMGLALFPRDGSGWDELLARARTAAERAAASQSDYAFHEEGLTVRSKERLQLEQEFVAASDEAHLFLHYQPVVAMTSGRVVGAEALARGNVLGLEALARWPHPRRGLVPPAEFIPIAESTGRILSLDRWAVATAIRQASRWWERGWTGWVSVNLSTRSLADPTMAEYVARLLESRDIPPERLMLEITETAAMRDPDATIAVLHALKDVGIRLALDDFGTGHSSLAYLKRLPVDLIKLDRSFIAELGEDERDRWVVEAILALAHRIGATVVAEGVERPEDLEWLRAAGCDLAQGFLLGRPAPAEELDPADA